MAIDTAAKRFSIMDFDLPTQPGMDPPDGAMAAGDRSIMLWLYNGIALGSPAGNVLISQFRAVHRGKFQRIFGRVN